MRAQYDCCHASDHTNNKIDFSQAVFSFQICVKESGKEDDRRPVDSVEGRCEEKGIREYCDVGSVRDKTFEVV